MQVFYAFSCFLSCISFKQNCPDFLSPQTLPPLHQANTEANVANTYFVICPNSLMTHFPFKTATILKLSESPSYQQCKVSPRHQLYNATWCCVIQETQNSKELYPLAIFEAVGHIVGGKLLSKSHSLMSSSFHCVHLIYSCSLFFSTTTAFNPWHGHRLSILYCPIGKYGLCIWPILQSLWASVRIRGQQQCSSRGQLLS